MFNGKFNVSPTIFILIPKCTPNAVGIDVVCGIYGTIKSLNIVSRFLI